MTFRHFARFFINTTTKKPRYIFTKYIFHFRQISSIISWKCFVVGILTYCFAKNCHFCSFHLRTLKLSSAQYYESTSIKSCSFSLRIKDPWKTHQKINNKNSFPTRKGGGRVRWIRLPLFRARKRKKPHFLMIFGVSDTSEKKLKIPFFLMFFPSLSLSKKWYEKLNFFQIM